ncbi:MAG TPA: carbon-nitrogen hydrolase family protein [Terriglobales bacterium]|nr:carbon-nitrogen hydrolase family protein [Terriglobales bacterium]
MPGDKYPRVKVAAAQAAPVFLDRDATIDKVAQLVPKAKELGAELVAFPESFIPAFPVWTILHAPIDQHDFYRRLFENAVLIPSPQTRKLGEIARANETFLSVGCTEKSDYSMGAMWCTQLLFDKKGKLINRHRKLMPTWAEMLAWGPGDASDLRPVQTEIGKIGTLICGENTNTLARFALLAQGEQIHIASYPPAWPFRRAVGKGGSYDLKEVIRLRAAAHAFEGKVFVVASSASLDEDAIEQISGGVPENRALLENVAKSASMIIGPTGEIIGEAVVGGEGFAVAEIDLSDSINLKEAHDILGRYNRFDVFQLHVNQTRIKPVRLYSGDSTFEEYVPSPCDYEELTDDQKAADSVKLRIKAGLAPED